MRNNLKRRFRQHLRSKLKRRVRVDHRCRKPGMEPDLLTLTKLRSDQKPKGSDHLGDKHPVKPASRWFV
eukprot:791708-Amphidinium_carterae.1